MIIYQLHTTAFTLPFKRHSLNHLPHAVGGWCAALAQLFLLMGSDLAPSQLRLMPVSATRWQVTWVLILWMVPLVCLGEDGE